MKSLTDQELDKLLCLESSQTYTPAFASRRTTGAPAQRLTLWFTSREVVILRSVWSESKILWLEITCVRQDRRAALCLAAQGRPRRPLDSPYSERRNYERLG